MKAGKTATCHIGMTKTGGLNDADVEQIHLHQIYTTRTVIGVFLGISGREKNGPEVAKTLAK